MGDIEDRRPGKEYIEIGILHTGIYRYIYGYTLMEYYGGLVIL